MDGDRKDVAASLDARVDQIIDACTACGKCLEICPMTVPAEISIDSANAKAVTAGVLEILKTGSGPHESEKWASLCSQTGRCIDQCEYGVNPRFMLVMARRAMKHAKVDQTERQAKGKFDFQKMVKGVRAMSGMQLPKAAINNYVRPPKGGDGAPVAKPDIVFWTGCNVWRTPHIVMHCLDILDGIGASYEVLGGPGNCCGIIQLRTGDDDNALRQAGTSNDKFAATGAGEVVSWCPTCHMQFDETVFQGSDEVRPYDTSLFAGFLASRIDDLKKAFMVRVERRVGLHLHGEMAGVNHGVRCCPPFRGLRSSISVRKWRVINATPSKARPASNANSEPPSWTRRQKPVSIPWQWCITVATAIFAPPVRTIPLKWSITLSCWARPWASNIRPVSSALNCLAVVIKCSMQSAK